MICPEWPGKLATFARSFRSQILTTLQTTTNIQHLHDLAALNQAWSIYTLSGDRGRLSWKSPSLQIVDIRTCLKCQCRRSDHQDGTGHRLMLGSIDRQYNSVTENKLIGFHSQLLVCKETPYRELCYGSVGQSNRPAFTLWGWDLVSVTDFTVPAQEEVGVLLDKIAGTKGAWLPLNA